MTQKSSNDRLSEVSMTASRVECETALALAFVVFPHRSRLFDRQSTDNAADHIHGNTMASRPLLCCGHWGEEDDQLANQTVKNGALGRMRRAAGRAAAAATCAPLHSPRFAGAGALVVAAAGRGPASSAARPGHLVIEHAPCGYLGKFERVGSQPRQREQRHVGYCDIRHDRCKAAAQRKAKIVVLSHVYPAEACVVSAVDRCSLACQMPSYLTLF